MLTNDPRIEFDHIAAVVRADRAIKKMISTEGKVDDEGSKGVGNSLRANSSGRLSAVDDDRNIPEKGCKSNRLVPWQPRHYALSVSRNPSPIGILNRLAIIVVTDAAIYKMIGASKDNP